jgi:hypothetical protein
MNLYLIDYENVTDTGFLGVKELTADDTVIVFYSQHTKNISFERHIELSQSLAHFEYIKISKTGKNYLDFQLSTYLGFLIGKDKPEHVYIITNDTGYDSVIDFWSAKNIDIIRQKSIVPPAPLSLPANIPPQMVVRKQKADAALAQTSSVTSTSAAPAKPAASGKKTKASASPDLPEAWRKKVRMAVKSDKLAPSSYSVVYRAISGSQNKTELNNQLVKAFQSSKGGRVYGHVREIFEQYSKESN